MEIVRVPEAHELAPEDQPFLEGAKSRFKIDFVPRMSRVLLTVPEFGRPYGRASRRAMTDGRAEPGPEGNDRGDRQRDQRLRILNGRTQCSREAARTER